MESSILLNDTVIGVISLSTLLFQGTATLILLSRLLKGAMRRPPLKPQLPDPEMLGKVSVVVPTLNEAERITPCLQGLGQQSYEVREIIVVDSHSQDGTQELVKTARLHDPRFRLITDGPLPSGWVGRPWALHNGFLHSSPRSEWVLGIDADTQPQRGLVASLVKVAEEEGYDIVSLSPQFILKDAGEWWLQPALLMTLLYRFDSAGVREQSPDRVMANGQCFLSRRSVLDALEGYSCAASSFCDDVTLARDAAKQGFKVGFLDGKNLIRVRMYEGVKETWNEWGRSLDLKDATSPPQVWGDLILLLLTQALPLFLLIVFVSFWLAGNHFLSLELAIALNLILVIIRFALLFAVFPSYYKDKSSLVKSLLFWLSPFADPLAVLRIFLSSLQTPKQWRGRTYSHE
ncbi:unknown [Crocosphaera subtropica ATCC 51142]|uniref:Glycosyltransferase 2-like domain-containing protein n=1 Tax=Crocosphaera subtropica (strain ATCC 51142 / BH68) TaxID=43989 RepID=B1WX29_CROS5|nr:glycosyltransferase family 2 protein [Crocosphaera subtropica]ACB54095.1 unknown [Crocosphaera subtropica ATCC 51142]